MKAKLDEHTCETPPLTEPRREHLAELAGLPDEPIDTSDISETSDEALNASARTRIFNRSEQLDRKDSGIALQTNVEVDGYSILR